MQGRDDNRLAGAWKNQRGHHGAAVNGMLAEYCQMPPTRDPTRT